MNDLSKKNGGGVRLQAVGSASAVFVIALALRWAFLAGTPDRSWPHCALYEGDGPLWVRFSESLRNGKPFEFDLPIHSPGMAYTLSLIGASEGKSFLPIKIVLGVLGSISCVFAYSLGRRWFGNRIGIAAGLLSAFSFGLIVQCASVNSETPYSLLLLISLVLLVRFADRPSVRLGLALGCVHALAALFRAEHTLFFLLSMVYLLGRSIRAAGSKRSIAPLFAQVAVFVLVPALWNIRSYSAIQRFNTTDTEPMDYASAAVPWSDETRVFLESLPAFARGPNARHIAYQAAQEHRSVVDRAFVDAYFERMGYVPAPLSPYTFISNQGAFSFAMANNELAEGGFSSLLLDEGSEQRATRGQVSASDFYFANPRHLRLFQQGYRIGGQYLIDHPAEALRLMWKKLNIFTAGLASGFTEWNAPLGVVGERPPVDQFVVTRRSAAARPGVPVPWRLLIVILVVTGLIECAKRRTGGLIALVLLYKLFITLAFYGYARESVSILPIVYILVALGLYRLTPAWIFSNAKFASSAPAVTFSLVAVILTLSIVDGARGWAYQVYGSGDPAPQWGPSAFESSQPLEIHRISRDERLSTGYRVG